MKTEIFKYCPFCGSATRKLEYSYVQCTNEKCGEVFAIVPTQTGINMCYIETPFSKISGEDKNENT